MLHRAIPLLSTTLLFVACQPSTPPPPVPVPPQGSALADLIDKTPIVDIHTHTFNSRFLPIREIALGKRDFLGNFAFLASDGRTKALTKSITRWTIAREKNSHPLPPAPSDEEGSADEIALADSTTAKIMNPGKFSREDRELTYSERRQLEKFAATYAHPDGILSFLPFLTPLTHNGEYEHFVYCLTTPISETETRFRSDLTVKKEKTSKITLNVSHMMDMAPTYDQAEDGKTLVPIAKQIPTMQSQQASADGHMLYFAAYNPFRDHWQGDPAARPGHALEIVKDAYQNHGAFGVKIYPPSGYFPLGNYGHIPGRPGPRFSQPRRQWDARYKINDTQISGQEIDASLLQLFTWCSANDVPIFAHCGQGEVQAQRGYDAFANPENWRPVLAKFPNLRLCFGHAGGGSEWYSNSPISGWGSTVFELCRDYRNVYCEFGCQDSISDPVKRANFSTQIATLTAASQALGQYSFSTKILYGTDWFMPMPHSSDRLNHLRAHQTAIYNAGGSELYKNYLYRNALQFLNAKERLKKSGIPPALRANLRQLLQRNQ